jgi:dolichyl-phosphate beta-glucosyltransferase
MRRSDRVQEKRGIKLKTKLVSKIKMISIVIPAYNESKRILPSLEKVRKYCAKRPFQYEILVVDDGSKDDSVSVIKKFFQKNKEKNVVWKCLPVKPNQGKGNAVRTGMLKASGDIVVFSDADLSTPIVELDKMLEYVKEGFDVVIGSRALRESKIEEYQPIYRVLMGKTFNLFVRMMTVRKIHDTQCGFKLFTSKAVLPVFSRQTIKGFGFDVEILYLAQKLGFSIKEMPVVWKNDKFTTVRPVKDAVRMFRDLVHIRRMSFKGKYA